LIPRLHGALISGTFFPAAGNVLLIGDAAGLLLPITFEGIGTALKSGLLAADAIADAAEHGKEAAGGYLRKLKSILETLERLHDLNTGLTRKKMEDSDLSKAIRDAYEETLKIV
jgi:flavin-dependent dehydrogenase